MAGLCRSEYNLHPGGNGGFEYINGNKLNVYGNNGKPGFRPPNSAWIGKKASLETRKKMSTNKLGNTNWLGKHHKEESKKKIGQKNSMLQSGSKNSQFGTMWITNGSSNKKIKKDVPIPNDWYPGRS